MSSANVFVGHTSPPPPRAAQPIPPRPIPGGADAAGAVFADSCIDPTVLGTNGVFEFGRDDYVWGVDSTQPITISTERKPVKMINQYLLGARIGEGSSGKVKDGIDSRTLRRVAVKIIKWHYLKRHMEAAKREVAVLRLLRHANVPELFEVVYSKEKRALYVITEFVSGGSVEDLIGKATRGRLPLCQCRHLFAQLIDGLEYIHRMGVVHRDIKPSNLLVTPEGQLKIIDFGLADILDPYAAMDEFSHSYGSPAFQAPEIHMGGTAMMGSKIDVFASGVTLCLMATGKPPFDGESIMDLRTRMSSSLPALDDDLDIDLRDLLMGLLESDPEARLSFEDVRSHPFLAKPLPDDDFVTPDESTEPSLVDVLERLYEDGGEKLASTIEGCPVTALPDLFSVKFGGRNAASSASDLSPMPTRKRMAVAAPDGPNDPPSPHPIKRGAPPRPQEDRPRRPEPGCTLF